MVILGIVNFLIHRILLKFYSRVIFKMIGNVVEETKDKVHGYSFMLKFSVRGIVNMQGVK
jgi:hypothetical protein